MHLLYIYVVMYVAKKQSVCKNCHVDNSVISAWIKSGHDLMIVIVVFLDVIDEPDPCLTVYCQFKCHYAVLVQSLLIKCLKPY